MLVPVPHIVPHPNDPTKLLSVSLVTTYTSGWSRFAITWDDERAPFLDLLVRMWRLCVYGRFEDVEHVEVSPDGKLVYLDGCMHCFGQPYDAWFPTHGHGTLGVKEWTEDGRPVLFAKTWNHMMGV